MVARNLALLVLLVAPLASCKTWPSHPVDGGARGDAAAVEAGSDGPADDAIDASEDAVESDATDVAPPEDGAPVQEAGAAIDGGPAADTGLGPDA
jgi:hypothetical protein